MAHIVYVAAEDFRRESGVTQKIRAQVRSWQRYGHNVSINATTSGSRYSDFRGVRWLHRLNGLVADAAATRADVLYIRFATWTPAISRASAVSPVYLEFNGDDLAELATRRRVFRVYHRLTRARAITAAAGIVVPSQELARRAHFADLARSIAVVPNGIDLASVEQLSAPVNERPVLGFTYTSTGPWTGLEDVLRLAERLPEFDFSIVGPMPTRPLPSNVLSTGYLTGAAFSDAMSRLDVGIGSLALHRAGLTEASTLKVRGYLAAGIPAIIGYEDTDFDADAPFLLNVPNAEGGVLSRVDEVRDFVLRWVGRRVIRAEIQHIDIAVKESQRLDFILSRM